MKNYVQQGHTLTVVFPYGASSGGGVKVGNIFGVAVNTQVTSDNGEIQLTGVFDIAKDSSTFAEGDPVFWDDTNKVATSTPSGTMHIGVAAITQPSGTNALGGSSGDATVRVRLNAAFGTSAGGGLRVAHAIYNFAVDGGAVGAITPANSDTIPANAVVMGGAINPATAVTSGGSATVAVGTAAGSSATSILGATGKASFTLDAVLASVAGTTPFKMSAPGKINITVGTAALTAGLIEIWVFYVVADEA